MPDYWSTLYVTNSLRARHLRLGTIEKHLQALQSLFMWAELRGINLIDKISSGKAFNINDIDSLTSILKLRADELPKLISSVYTNTCAMHVKASLTRNIWKKFDAIPRQVTSANFNDKIKYIGKYVEWLSNILSDYHSKSITREQIRTVGYEFKTYLGDQKVVVPKDNFGASKSLGNAEIQRILNVANPLSPENPWVGEATRIRNFTIILVLLDSGMRSGELLNLKITDVIRSKSKQHGLRIVQRSGSLNDPRKKQRLPKTVQREVAISDTAFKALDYYITEIKAKTPNGQKTEYIFVSHSNSNQGKPLHSINSVTEAMRNVTSIDLTPHVLRHTATWKYCVRMKKKGKEWKDFVELLLLQFGWTSENSPTVRLYARKFIKEELFERQIKQQDEYEQEVSNIISLLNEG
ncbi:site-specific integrase [Aeromonas jandaei]|uniref:site-specific integrase n=1 Tax=Aeromonas jandaei TaxID=650 RepID=UPI002AA0D3D7|nr:site-specific integrase [Aeromonas jandaei]